MKDISWDYQDRYGIGEPMVYVGSIGTVVLFTLKENNDDKYELSSTLPDVPNLWVIDIEFGKYVAGLMLASFFEQFRD